MKCIKDKNGVIIRVKDEEAIKKVNSGSYTYVRKKEWKEKTKQQ